jgi:hypothetical protein
MHRPRNEWLKTESLGETPFLSFDFNFFWSLTKKWVIKLEMSEEPNPKKIEMLFSNVPSKTLIN